MSSVEIHFVGTGDAFGGGGRFQTCFRVTTARGQLLIDCGATSLTALKRADVEPNRIGTVVLTHLHGDHFGGIPFLILDGQFRGRERPLLVGGPPGTHRRIEAAMELFFPGSSRASRQFETTVVELAAKSPTHLDHALVTAFPVEQPGTPACALRLECDGRVIAYSGDTAWTNDLMEVARGADLFIAEAYFFAKQVPHHLDYETLRAVRDRLDCRRILLTHMSPDMLARQDEAEFECAYDEMVVSL